MSSFSFIIFPCTVTVTSLLAKQSKKMGRILIRCFLATMAPNKERRHGNISTLMCYFWRGVLVYLGSGWDCQALNRGIPAAEPVCDKLGLRWHIWRPTATCDAEPSAEQTGSCQVFPVSATLRQAGATFSSTKVEVWRIRAQTEQFRAARMLTHPWLNPLFTVWHPSPRPPLRWYFRRSKAPDLPWLFWRLHLTAVARLCGYMSQAHNPDISSSFQHASKCQLFP